MRTAVWEGAAKAVVWGKGSNGSNGSNGNTTLIRSKNINTLLLAGPQVSKLTNCEETIKYYSKAAPRKECSRNNGKALQSTLKKVMTVSNLV